MAQNNGPVKVIVMEDTVGEAISCQKEFSNLGFDTQFSSANKETFEWLLHVVQPDAVFADYEIFKNSGCKLNKKRNPNLLCSAATLFEESIEEAQKAGFEIVLTKPVDYAYAAILLRHRLGLPGCIKPSQAEVVAMLIEQLNLKSYTIGSEYLRVALNILLKTPEKLQGVHKLLYPEVGRICKANPAAVAKGLERLAKSIFEEGKFGTAFSSAPSNTEFLNYILVKAEKYLCN